MRLFPVRGGYYRISDRNAKILSEEWGGLPVRGVTTITVTLPNGCGATLSRRNYGSADGTRAYVWCVLPTGDSIMGLGIKQSDGSYLNEAKKAKEVPVKTPAPQAPRAGTLDELHTAIDNQIINDMNQIASSFASSVVSTVTII